MYNSDRRLLSGFHFNSFTGTLAAAVGRQLQGVVSCRPDREAYIWACYTYEGIGAFEVIGFRTNRGLRNSTEQSETKAFGYGTLRPPH